MPTRFAAALVAVLLVAPLARAAVAAPTFVGEHVPDAALVGEGRLRVMLWNVFDARLEAPDGRYDADAPFALTLSYLRGLDAHRIVDASIEEMTAQRPVDDRTLARWRAALERVIPDVETGTSITGVRDERGHTRFYRDGEPLGQVEDPAFTRAFFDIWLGEASSRPVLRDRLLARTSS